MTNALPKGLVTNSEAITGEIESIDYVAIEDIAQLWKVYTTNKAVFDGLVGPRLEYFFWRIWSSPRIHHKIRGSTVAREFLRISEGPSVIRTTPTQSPTLARSVSSARSTSSPHEPSRAVPPSDSRSAQESVPDVSLTPPSERNSPTPRGMGAADSRKLSKDFLEEDEIPASNRKDRRSATVLPPILKKPRAGSQNQLPKTARVISPAFDDSNGEPSGSDGLRSTSNLGVEPPTAAPAPAADLFLRAGSAASTTSATRPPISPSARSEKEPLQKPPKKRTAFVANSASNRRRPSAVRRKSSQSSSGSASKVTSPRLTAQAQAQERTIPESSVLELPRNSLPDSPGVALSPLSRTLILAAAHTAESQLDRASSASAVAGERSHQEWLVDRDFRSRFVDRRRHENLTANLARPVPKASAAAAAAASFQATGTLDFGEHPPAKGKGKGKVEVVPPKPEGTAGLAATENEESGPTAAPRRSKSQLSDLLDRDRRLSEGTSDKRGQQREKHRKSSS